MAVGPSAPRDGWRGAEVLAAEGHGIEAAFGALFDAVRSAGAPDNATAALLAIPVDRQDESAGEPIVAHQVDERITVERHPQNIRIYVIALALLAFDHDKVQEAIGCRREEASAKRPP